MSSAIACAADELRIDSNALIMVHNPWTITMGNANDIRKEADTLDKYRDALLAIYRTKFDTTDEVIKKMLDDETWFLGEQAPLFGMKAEVIPTDVPLRIAASAKMPKFAKMPKALKDIIMTKEEEIKQADEVKAEESQPVENQADETTAETVVEEPKAEVVEEETKAEETVEEKAVEEETVPKAEVEKRVSGMQSTMAKKMDAMKKDYEAKILDFQNQLKAKDEELEKAKADATSLAKRLEDSAKELSEMTSALEEKKNALAKLNANVLTPNESTTDWKALKGKAFFDWYQKTH
jgi:hypothetical protein